ncbi:sodium- and chloride-dependent betaine transporter-like [Neodiprion fabricii]|uniref:sodium- and chloride-dependent betaine transporter-like n=1 Tax=Neodiprion fabricii TaxID=2872261 RepID=UPI001ED8DDDE|nr:sodium- and chloride-dependent betaine transporter-like [Neodiprion fabricii]
MIAKRNDENDKIAEDEEERKHESISDVESENRRWDENKVFRNRLEYLAILFILQSGNNNFIVTVTKSAQYNGISFLILYYGIHHIVIAPLQCQHLFLGYYSKFGYIKIWNIFPIGYGIGASMMAFSLYTCIYWSALTGQLVLQSILIPFMPENYWTDCTYESENLPPCFELSSKPKNVDCNNTYYPGIAQYYRVSNLWRPDEKPDGIGPVNSKWVAASALVWVIVGILTTRDFGSFKGMFAKLAYSVTTIYFLMLLIDWASEGYSEKGTLLMLDFSGLFNYKIWVKAFTHAILMSHICEGTVIQLGSYGPDNSMPDTDVLLVGFLASILQYLGIYYVFSCYGSMADNQGLDTSCFTWPHEVVVTAFIPTQLSLLPMAKLWIVAVFLIFFIKGVMEMTIVFTATVNSFLEAFPSVKSYRSYLVSIVTLSCFAVSLIFTTKVGGIFINDFLDFVGTLVTLLILAIMTSLILFSYSVTRLCDDIQFMYKFEPNLLMKAMFYLTPLIATYYTIYHLAVFFSLPTRINTLYDELWELEPFLILSCISLVIPLLIVGLITYGIHVRTHTVGLLFYPTKYWGCPDEEMNVTRRGFNPRRELRYKVNKPCAHICLLDNKRMEAEIRKREAIRNKLKQYGLKTLKDGV